MRKSIRNFFISNKKIFYVYLFFLFPLLVFLAVPVIFRLALLVNFGNSLSFYDFLFVFFQGSFIDFIAVSVVILPFMLPFLFNYKEKKYVVLISLAEGILFSAWLFFFRADYIFYTVFARHLGQEIFSAFENSHFLISYAFSSDKMFSFFAVFAGIAVFILSFYYLGQKQGLNIKLNESLRSDKKLCCVPIQAWLSKIYPVLFAWLACIAFFCSLQDYFFNPPSSFNSVYGLYYISENPVFNIAWALKKNYFRRKLSSDIYSKKAIGNISEICSENEDCPDSRNMFLRKRKKFSLQNKKSGIEKPDFIIFFLESFNPEPLLKNAAFLPELKRIKKNSLFFSSFFSSGTRSRIALNSLLFSVPPVQGISQSGKIYGKNVFFPFAHYFRNMSYKTVYAQAGHFKDGIYSAQFSGFDETYHWKDMFGSGKETSDKASEEEGMSFFFEKIQNASRTGHFLGIYYTAVPHYPYMHNIPGHEPVSEKMSDEQRYAVMAEYVDSCIKTFMEKAEKESWFGNTYFIFMPDHRGHLVSDLDRTKHGIRDDFLSFLMIYSPKNIKAGIDNSLSGQEDILPTLLDIAGYDGYYLSAGGSLLDKSLVREKHVVYGEDGRIFIFRRQGEYSLFRGKHYADYRAERDYSAAIVFEEALYSALYDSWRIPDSSFIVRR